MGNCNGCHFAPWPGQPSCVWVNSWVLDCCCGCLWDFKELTWSCPQRKVRIHWEGTGLRVALFATRKLRFDTCPSDILAQRGKESINMLKSPHEPYPRSCSVFRSPLPFLLSALLFSQTPEATAPRRFCIRFLSGSGLLRSEEILIKRKGFFFKVG